MKKEDFLQKEVEIALNKINFINRLESISTNFNTRDENFKIDNEQILKICSDLGITCKYSKGKDFYYNEIVSGFKFGIGFSVRYQSFDFGISIKNETLKIDSSAPLDLWVNLISNGEKETSRIKFENYYDVKEILNKIFNIYLDLKNELLILISS